VVIGGGAQGLELYVWSGAACCAAYLTGALAVLRDRSTAHQAAPGWLVAPRLPIHGNQPEGAGPSRITPRTWSTDTPSHGNSTIHHVAPADA
jgi:hypothetical protein